MQHYRCQCNYKKLKNIKDFDFTNLDKKIDEVKIQDFR